MMPSSTREEKHEVVVVGGVLPAFVQLLHRRVEAQVRR